MTKKICIITSSRADWGYLKPLAERLLKNPACDLKLIVTGSHTDKRYGHTIDEILKAGIMPDACIDIIDDDSKQGILNTMAAAISKIGAELIKIKPDIAVLLGDRYETAAIAQACASLNIPIAHIAGGDVSYGAYDELFRHAATKMSRLHFTMCEKSRRRVIQMGENPDTVFNSGSLSLENLKTLKLMTKEEISRELNINAEKTVICSFHPVSEELNTQEKQFTEVLEALIEQDKYFTLFTGINADTGNGRLNEILNQYVLTYPCKIRAVKSLGIYRYFSLMQYAACVIGNSSSGILEAPSFHIPVINIGNRQKGRMQAEMTINCPADKECILKALNNLPSKEKLKNIKNPYEGKNPSELIEKEIFEYLSKPHQYKIFYDMPF